MNIDEMTYIGSFSVDSGQAIVGDPCYLDRWETWKNGEPFDYQGKEGQYGYLGACATTLKNGHGILGMGSAVAFLTGYGDGLYPVYAEFDESGHISKIVIDFVEDEADEELEAAL